LHSYYSIDYGINANVQKEDGAELLCAMQQTMGTSA
jgi:hypothetical protein